MAGKTGWLLIGEEGVILDCNDRLTARMRIKRESLVGRKVLDFMAPADRERCVQLYQQIKRDGRPFSTTRRIIRADRTHLWLRIEASSPAWTPMSGDIHVQIDECPAPAGWVAPDKLLAVAQSMARARRTRADTFDASLLADHAWDILLAAYLGEAEGCVLTTAGLHAELGMPIVQASRWLRVLGEQKLIEFEDNGSHTLITSSIRLTAAAHEKFERFLSQVYREHREATALVD